MNAEERTLSYLVPRRISQGFEFAPGWGVRQVKVLVAFVAVGLAVAALAYLATRSMAAVLSLALAGGAGYAVGKPMPDGSTMLDWLAAARTWAGGWRGMATGAGRRRNLWLYDWSREDIA